MNDPAPETLISPASATAPATAELLKRYAGGDAGAFEALTHRYHPLVLAAARRRCGGSQSLAEDAAQVVFIDLARRASGLRADERLGGWLHQRTLRAAADLMKSEHRRRRREAEAAAQVHNDNPDALWADAATAIDAALQRLSARDRDAVLLRCVEGRDLRDVGTALGLSADAAQKCVSRALEKLRTLLRRRGVVPAITIITAGLAADQARAAGFSAAAGRTAAHALQSVTAASTGASAPWILQAKAVAAGAALACAAWAWPIVQTVRKNTAAPPRAVATVNQGTTPGGLRPLNFPPLPVMAKGLSVDEILARAAALAPLPDSASMRERFRFLSGQLEGARAGEALQKMRAFPGELVAALDRHHWRHSLLQHWGWVQPSSAMDYAWHALPQDPAHPSFATFLDAITAITAQHEEPGPSTEYARWLSARMIEICSQPRGPRFARLFETFQNKLKVAAIRSKSRAVLEAVVTLANEHRLKLFEDAGSHTSDRECLELLADIAPLIESPRQRAALTESIIEKLGSMDFSAACKVVEQVDNPAQRLIYARKVGLPPYYWSGTSSENSKPVPQDRYKERADWLLGLVEDGQREKMVREITSSWVRMDPAWALQWMAGKLTSTSFVSWLDFRIGRTAGSVASSGLKSGRRNGYDKELPLLLKYRRQAGPDTTAEFIEKVRLENQRRIHAAELNALLDAP